MEKDNKTDKMTAPENGLPQEYNEELIQKDLEMVDHYCQQQDFMAAIALLTQLLKQHPTADALLRKRASVFLGLGLTKEAAQDLDSLQEMTLDDLVTRINLYIQNQETSQAFEILKKRNECNPKSKAEYLLISQLHSAQKDYNAAMDILQKGMDQIPSFPEAYKERGRIRMLLHDSKGAMDDLKKALEQDPDLLNNLNGTLSNQ